MDRFSHKRCQKKPLNRATEYIPIFIMYWKSVVFFRVKNNFKFKILMFYELLKDDKFWREVWVQRLLNWRSAYEILLKMEQFFNTKILEN